MVPGRDALLARVGPVDGEAELVPVAVEVGTGSGREVGLVLRPAVARLVSGPCRFEAG